MSTSGIVLHILRCGVKFESSECKILSIVQIENLEVAHRGTLSIARLERVIGLVEIFLQD